MKKNFGKVEKKKKKTLFSLWRDLFGSIFLVSIVFTTIINATYYHYERDCVVNQFQQWGTDWLTYLKNSEKFSNFLQKKCLLNRYLSERVVDQSLSL